MANFRSDRGSTNRDDLYKVADLINGGTREWKELTLQNMFAKDVIKEILAIPINHYPMADVLCWIANKTGDYTVRSRYNNQHSKSNKPDPSKATSSYQRLLDNYGQKYGISKSPLKCESFYGVYAKMPSLLASVS